jgi:hypothetical protein
MGFLKWVKKAPTSDPQKKARASAAIIDYVTGVLPSARLFADKKIIVTTPSEAFEEYIRNFDDEYAAFLRTTRALYAGVDPALVNYDEIKSMFFYRLPLLKRQADAIRQKWTTFENAL